MTSTPTLTGNTFGLYQIEDKVGEGGMATVYRAYQPSLHRNVALKVLRLPDKGRTDFLARFEREAALLAQFQHPNILPVFDFGEENGIPFIVMMFIGSGTLSDRLKEPLPIATAIAIGSQIAAALSYAHGKGVLHQDVKPSNILMGDTDWPLLADFGIAEVLNRPSSYRGATIGTPHYMSPERIRGNAADVRSDVFSLGVVAYEMLTARLPYDGRSAQEILQRQALGPPALPSSLRQNVSPGLDAALLKALARDPSARYQTAIDFKTALDREVGGSGNSRRRTIRPSKLPKSVAMPAALTKFRRMANSEQATRRRPVVRGRAAGNRFPGMAGLMLGLIVIVSAVLLLGGRVTSLLGTGTEDAAGREATSSVGILAVTSGPAPAEVADRNNDSSLEEQQPQRATLFEDGFEDQRGGWYQERGLVYLEGSQLHINLLNAQRGYATAPANGPKISDFVYEATISKLDGQNTAAYGVFFRGVGTQQFYLFGITGDGMFGVSRLRDGPEGRTFETLIDPAAHAAIQTGNNVQNKLKVDARGSHLTFFLNDTLVAEMDHDDRTSGGFGIAAESGVHIAASEVKVSAR